MRVEGPHIFSQALAIDYSFNDTSKNRMNHKTNSFKLRKKDDVAFVYIASDQNLAQDAIFQWGFKKLQGLWLSVSSGVAISCVLMF